MSRRRGGGEIHRFGLAKATIPIEKPAVSTATFIARTSLARKDPTFSQKWVAQDGYICLCEVFHHCDKQATLHDHYCQFCYGGRPGGCPNLLRYYPCDEGWWTMRHIAKKMRRRAGLQDYEDVLPAPPHCGCVLRRDPDNPGYDIQAYCVGCEK